jgi:hypothetical protein
MRRSVELTRGHRWKILIFAFAIIGVSSALHVATPPEGLGQLILAGINVIVNGIVTGYLNVVAAMIYHDLRTVKEGVDTEGIAAVFD